MPGRLEIGASWRAQGAPRRALQGAGSTQRLLLLADFSGRASRSAHDAAGLRGRRPVAVDFERLASVMQTMMPRVALSAGTLQINTLEDFHPDRLIASLPGLGALEQARHLPPAAPLAAPPAAPPGTEDDNTTINRLLGRPASTPAPAATGIDALLRQVVAPHVVAAVPTAQPHHTAALAEQLRAVLADPGLQAVEAAWRGVEWLLSRLELDDGLELHLLDCTRQELAADLVAAAGQPSATGLLHALTLNHRPDDEPPWLALIGLFDFDSSTLDLALLAALGSIGRECGAPFIGGAGPALTHAALQDRVAAGWQMLCASDVAPWLALAGPRLLMRAPYGRGGEAVETLAFEEVIDGANTHDLLWAPGSLFCALAVGQAVSVNPLDPLNPGRFEVDGLPALLTGEQGVLCAEQRLDDNQAEALQNHGLVALRGHRGRHSVLLQTLHSVAGWGHPLGE